MLFHRHRLGIIILFLSDIVILFMIFCLAFLSRLALPIIFSHYPEFLYKIINYWWLFPIWLGIMLYEGGYTKKFTLWDEVKLLWQVSLFSTIAILTIVSLGQLSHLVSRTLILLMGLLSIGVYPPLRIAIKRGLVSVGLLKSKVLILGTDEPGKRILRALRREPNLGYDVVGFIDDKSTRKRRFIDGIKVYGYVDKIERYIKNCDIQDVVIAVSDINKEKLSQLLNKLQHRAESVIYVPDYSGMAVLGTELRHFFHDQLFALEIKNNLAQPLNYLSKILFDYMVSLILLLVFLLPILFISALIRITSRGPAIYKQKRIGKHGKPFMCYKFRTMYNNADERLRSILLTDPSARSEWQAYRKMKNDPRITKIGNFLRTTSLDEIPQIFNVLRGEMSLVGPRPVTQVEIELYYKDKAELCFCVPPGITGLWQVSGRSNTSYEHRVSLDAWYVRNWNIWLDIVLLMKTVFVVLKKEGAR